MTILSPFIIALVFLLSLSSPLQARSKALPPKALKDVPKTHWASDYVRDLYDNGVMVGDPNGNFRGNSAMTRYEMAVALTSLMNNYNKELLEDREDLASLVNIMEQFQKELATINQKLSDLGLNVGAVSGVVGEVQEQNEAVIVKVEETGEELAIIKQDLEKLKNRGLVFGTLHGVANDVRSVGKGAVYVAKKFPKPQRNTNDEASKEVDAEVLESPSNETSSEEAPELPLKETKSVTREITTHQETRTLTKESPVESQATRETPKQLEAKPVAREIPSREEIKPVVREIPPHEEIKAVTSELSDRTNQRNYVPRKQSLPPVRSTNYASPSLEVPSPKATKLTEDKHKHQYSQELDGEIIQEIHQTLEEMH